MAVRDSSTASAKCRKECLVCMETKEMGEFPARSLTPSCSHVPSTCHQCISDSIKTQFEATRSDRITCPECPRRLGIDEIRSYMDGHTLTSYLDTLVANLAARVPNLARCPLGYGHAQVHGSGARQPIVLCQGCGGQYCFAHGTAWHREHTCEEYDRFLRDPAFRSRAQAERRADEAVGAHVAELRRRVERADEQHQLVLLREGRAAEARRAAIERARLERERQRAAEQAAAEERRRRELEEARAQAERQVQNQLSEEALSRRSKPCINCGIHIEKNGGCNHMTCTRCGMEFHWVSLERWTYQHARDPYN